MHTSDHCCASALVGQGTLLDQMDPIWQKLKYIECKIFMFKEQYLNCFNISIWIMFQAAQYF